MGNKKKKKKKKVHIGDRYYTAGCKVPGMVYWNVTKKATYPNFWSHCEHICMWEVVCFINMECGGHTRPNIAQTTMAHCIQSGLTITNCL